MDGQTTGTTVVNEYIFDDSRMVAQLEALNEKVETLTLKVDDLQSRLDEGVTIGGEMQGYLMFGVTVVLCIFAYKFFRMFF